jgi:hypothetical protein
MSYGEATRALRDALTTLLTDHPHPLPRPRAAQREHVIAAQAEYGERRAEYAAQMLRYRLTVLQWAHTTITASVPHRARATGIMWVAPVTLKHKIRAAVDLAEMTVRHPTQAELATPHAQPVVEAWRQAAAAAVRCLTDEQDALDGLSRSDALLAIRDTCDLARALVILDDRCHSLPGWQHLSGGHYAGGGGYSYSWGLLRAAERCAIWANTYRLTPDLDGRGNRDGDFDHHGAFHLRQDVTPGPYPPGLPGAIDALHNGLVRLDTQPEPALLRHLLIRNFHLSTELMRLARTTTGQDDDVTHDLGIRAHTYRALLDETTSLGGTGSRDPGPIHEYDTALTLLRGTTTASQDDINVLHRLLVHTDQRLAQLIRGGIATQDYLVARGKTTTRAPVGAGTRTVPRLVPVTHRSAGPLIHAVTALASYARIAHAAVDQPRPDMTLIAADALTHRDQFAGTIYARRRGTTRAADRDDTPKGPQLRGMAHIRHNEISGPATSLDDLHAYLQYAVHNRRHHRWSPPAERRPTATQFRPRNATNRDEHGASSPKREPEPPGM